MKSCMGGREDFDDRPSNMLRRTRNLTLLAVYLTATTLAGALPHGHGCAVQGTVPCTRHHADSPAGAVTDSCSHEYAATNASRHGATCKSGDTHDESCAICKFLGQRYLADCAQAELPAPCSVETLGMHAALRPHDSLGTLHAPRGPPAQRLS